MSVQEPTVNDNLRQQIVDDEHLKLLRIGYFASAAMTALMSLFALLYAFLGFFVFSQLPNQVPAGSDTPPAFVGRIIGLFGFVFAGLAIAFAAAKVYTGQLLKQRRSRVF